MKYNWVVFINNKIVGYVKSESEYYAVKIAKEKLAKNQHFFIERVCLGNPIPAGKEFHDSNLNIRDEIIQ